MRKTMLGGILGGIVLFLWSFFAWTVLSLHESTFHKIAREDEAALALPTFLDQKGVYSLPKHPGIDDKSSMDAWEEKLKRGPNALIFYDPYGVDPFMPRQMVIGLILDILAAWIVCWFLARSIALKASYVSRVAYCGMFGLFVSLFTHLTNWNWMGFPTDFTSAMVIDAMISWILAGLVIATIIKTPKISVP